MNKRNQTLLYNIKIVWSNKQNTAYFLFQTVFMCKISACKIISPTWSGVSLRKMQTRLSKCSLAAGSFLFLWCLWKLSRNESREKTRTKCLFIVQIKIWQESSFLENQKEIWGCTVCWEKTKSACPGHHGQVKPRFRTIS